jgi:hypothetical protein
MSTALIIQRNTRAQRQTHVKDVALNERIAAQDEVTELQAHHTVIRRQLETTRNELILANSELKEQLHEANDLIQFWANGSETFRRTMRHLHENWAPKSPQAETDLTTLMAEQRAVIKDDPAWPERKAIESEKRLGKPPRSSKRP